MFLIPSKTMVGFNSERAGGLPGVGDQVYADKII